MDMCFMSILSMIMVSGGPEPLKSLSTHVKGVTSEEKPKKYALEQFLCRYYQEFASFISLSVYVLLG